MDSLAQVQHELGNQGQFVLRVRTHSLEDDKGWLSTFFCVLTKKRQTFMFFIMVFFFLCSPQLKLDICIYKCDLCELGTTLCQMCIARFCLKEKKFKQQYGHVEHLQTKHTEAALPSLPTS